MLQESLPTYLQRIALFGSTTGMTAIMDAKVSGLSHVTLAVSDLARSVLFYRDVLGCNLRASWLDGAYLEAGSFWLCLSLDRAAQQDPRPDYTHLAFSVSEMDFDAVSARIRDHAEIWKENRSEGASLYFLDPDGHKLEIHVGSLETRLAHYRAEEHSDVRIFESKCSS